MAASSDLQAVVRLRTIAEYASLFYDGPAGSRLAGLDTGFTVHYIGQYWDTKDFTKDGRGRKIREWTTLDWILNYTFNFPASAAQNEVAGYAKDGGKNATMKGGKDKNVMPVSTAEYNPCGWRAWLNNTTSHAWGEQRFRFSAAIRSRVPVKTATTSRQPISRGEPGMWR